MYKELIHIYGPFSIQSYGLLIALGLLLTIWLFKRHPKRKGLLTEDQLVNLIAINTLAGILGGRLLHVIAQWHAFDSWYELFALWEGGFSLMGTVVTILITLPLTLRWYKIPIVPFLDLVALYAPLLQSISRLGCFLAGCCYGMPTSLPWSVTYTDPEGFAPLCVRLHPTQLYSTLVLLVIFLLLYFVIQPRTKKTGMIITWYLVLMSAERFLVDFLRGHREFTAVSGIFSLHQLIALGIFIISCGILVLLHTNMISYSKKP